MSAWSERPGPPRKWQHVEDRPSSSKVLVELYSADSHLVEACRGYFRNLQLKKQPLAGTVAEL
jgi:hypothetical protein